MKLPPTRHRHHSLVLVFEEEIAGLQLGITDDSMKHTQSFKLFLQETDMEQRFHFGKHAAMVLSNAGNNIPLEFTFTTSAYVEDRKCRVSVMQNEHRQVSKTSMNVDTHFTNISHHITSHHSTSLDIRLSRGRYRFSTASAIIILKERDCGGRSRGIWK